MKRFFFLVAILATVFTQYSCQEDNSLSAEKEEIKSYLEENNLLDRAVETEEGLFYVMDVEGTGETFPTRTSTVTIKYTGSLLNGQIFDTSGGSPRQFPLSNTILGWQLGIPYFKKDSKGLLLIPSSLAYGEFDRPSIPGGSILRFDIELDNFVN